jgi:hypothetical protein
MAEPESLELEGEIVITSGTPDDRSVQLDTEGEASWLLHSTALEGELLKLGGHRVCVWGTVGGSESTGDRRNAAAVRKSDGAAVLLVDRYVMLPVDGMTPMIGRLGTDDDRVVFSARGTGDRYVLAGPLSEALKLYAGCSVWVWGRTAGADGGGEASILDVRGYGVLGPAKARGETAPDPRPVAGRPDGDIPTETAPSDTLHNW